MPFVVVLLFLALASPAPGVDLRERQGGVRADDGNGVGLVLRMTPQGLLEPLRGPAGLPNLRCA